MRARRERGGDGDEGEKRRVQRHKVLTDRASKQEGGQNKKKEVHKRKAGWGGRLETMKAERLHPGERIEREAPAPRAVDKATESAETQSECHHRLRKKGKRRAGGLRSLSSSLINHAGQLRCFTQVSKGNVGNKKRGRRRRRNCLNLPFF
jgi:hypothetical protein